jgi:hypothetical protein
MENAIECLEIKYSIKYQLKIINLKEKNIVLKYQYKKRIKHYKMKTLKSIKSFCGNLVRCVCDRRQKNLYAMQCT